jgi:hypothetical protein
MSNLVELTGGRNIAMKVPPHFWEETVAFYRDIAGLNVIDMEPTSPPSVCCEFGANRLWIDRVDGLSQAEVRLELAVTDAQAAASQLEAAGIVRRDEIEPLPEDLDGFWIQNPASIIHLIVKETEQ